MKSKLKVQANQVLSWCEGCSLAEVLRDTLRERVQVSLLGMVDNLFQQEVKMLCGERYSPGCRQAHKRAGSERGSIYWEGQRRAVTRPRVRRQGHEMPLEAYRALRDYDLLSDEVMQLVIRGISTRDYATVVRKMEGDLGLSRSSVSRAFQHASRKELDAINGRDLAEQQFCALMIDGIEQAGLHVIVALGFTVEGYKVILGLREGATENQEVVKDLLQAIIDRHLATTEKILVVVDGAKALTSAVKAHFGNRAQIQRCQEHKIRNVLSYLPEDYQAEAQRRLRAGYGMKKRDQAHHALQRVRAWLAGHSEAAAKSLDEGLEETLTVHRLQLPDILRTTFHSTNPLESLFDKVEYRRHRVKRWKNATQQTRWIAASLLIHEKKFRRIRGYQELPLMVAALNKLKLDTATGAA